MVNNLKYNNNETFEIFCQECLSPAPLFTACESNNNAFEKDLDRLDAYLDSVKTATPVYTEDGWDKIKTEYNNTIAKMDNAGEKMSDDVNKKVEEVKAEYNSLKDDYEVKIREEKERTAANNYKQTLRAALFGDQQVGDDMQFNFVTAKNALPVYDRFVTSVKDNQAKYSREDWDEIKVLYEALDTRKNEIEKDLATSDNMKIAKLKVQFASIKAVKRPVAKMEENDDAKK